MAIKGTILMSSSNSFETQESCNLLQTLFMDISGANVPKPLDPKTPPPPLNPWLPVPTVQQLFAKLLTGIELIDEIYMQLIRITNNHGEPDSQAALMNWRLFCVLCGFREPATPEVFELLKAHLKRCSVVDSRLDPSKMRKEEAKHAKYCHKALMKRLIAGGPRVIVPSPEEIRFASVNSICIFDFEFLDPQM
jgi:hypothetical protein